MLNPTFQITQACQNNLLEIHWARYKFYATLTTIPITIKDKVVNNFSMTSIMSLEHKLIILFFSFVAHNMFNLLFFNLVLC